MTNTLLMVHSEVYLNKYVVSIAPFSIPACRKLISFLHVFTFLIFHPFSRGSADPICMCGRPCKQRATCIVYELVCLGCRRTRRMRLRGAIQLGLLTEVFVVLVPVDYRPRITGVDHRGVCRPCTSRLQAADNRTRPPRGLSSLYQSTTGRG